MIRWGRQKKREKPLFEVREWKKMLSSWERGLFRRNLALIGILG
jgi:hypothetical protein